ncbi:ergothioneine biosynthesis protein EgtC [Nocardia jinanensis]|uniref:Gamma-glutamyl-hercynylcysteine sulfoxide hydrolase n=1 Tax=Nocardia jinanensis TaxID=382504 RepID=A0A917VZX7_9NOCA|nr:ergothioneine biosynthesis protein EgtC [Nocardia jinanensis]GGL45149.1 gamma-glutamyl-hercynylcysteine sulfoxide hydrolase [Nocardia jinanensis]
MCRHIGYVGPAVPVGEVLTRGPHSLRTQAWAPREMRGGGTINADGFGVAWWGPNPAPVTRYRNAEPIWTDPAVDEVLPQLTSHAVLGSVRSATVGMPVERSACAPFLWDRWAFSHNGVVPRWRSVLTAVLSDLDVAATRAGMTRRYETSHLLEAEALTDSAALWVLLSRLLDPEPPAGLAETPGTALRLLVTGVLHHAPDARVNLLLGDGARLWATTCYHSLYALIGDDFAVLASEPYDDDTRWRQLPDRSLVHAEPGGLSIETLELGRSTATESLPL